MIIHDFIKLTYSNMGYLPGYPYYLISDDEMFNAFTKEDGVFNDYYPCPCNGDCANCLNQCPVDGEGHQIHPNIAEAYQQLKDYMFNMIAKYQSGDIDAIPDWIYSYMLFSCIAYQSSELDVDYLNTLLGLDITKGEPEFTLATARGCYNISSAWLKKQPNRTTNRPPSMFGEPHVVKSLRLDQANILTEGN